MASETPIVGLAHCLFCGKEFDGDRTMEDVFPKWLQAEYGLANEELVLLNGTSVTYSRLLVPACAECNNVHASHLERRIKEDRASEQDMYVWLLKLQLGAMHWETSKPLSQDRRLPASRTPILPSDAFDIEFLHALFDVLKRPDPQFAPNPLGSIFSFETEQEDFYYADKLYRHPMAGEDADNFSASCIVIHGRCWIALFDDCKQIRDSAADVTAMRRQVDGGKNPVVFFPELMFMRACLDWMPHTVVMGPRDAAARGVMFVPPMGQPRQFPRRLQDLRLFFESVGIEVDEGC
jgi:hypothetical protein